MMKLLPGRTWPTIESRGRKLGLRRPAKSPISKFLRSRGDIGFSAGMIIADGSVMEILISIGTKRDKLEGGVHRKPVYHYTLPQVQVSMEDKASLSKLAKMWGSNVRFCQKSSVGNDVWRVAVQGTKAYDLLRLVLPYLAGVKKRKAIFLIRKYKERKSIKISDPKDFRAFSGMK